MEGGPPTVTLSSPPPPPDASPARPVRIANPPSLPWVIYDTHCGFCKVWVARWKRRFGDRVFFVPYQEAAALYPALPIERFRHSVQRINPDGTVTEAAEAVFETLAVQPGGGLWLSLYKHLPGFAVFAEVVYRWIAGHRSLLYPTTRVLFAPPADPARSARRWLPLAAGVAALGAVGFVFWRRRRSR
jgi:predicted DCC family thiol-disulfide oxidoreductase YuxK